MEKRKKLTLINDPIYGFITIPTKLVFRLIEHPHFQRLRRISQMGMSYLVYPGAHHTRFHHALGAMHLMQKAVRVLKLKEVSVSEKEEEALYIAILLHDIGHGPFSHAMEHSLAEGIGHETISLWFMNRLNREFEGKLELAISIFKDEYDRKFMHQLVSGQLDMDRLDYLKRDSFYTGVSEGVINSERLIAMLNVHNDRLVVEYKGIYSVEKFIVARRLMYWQVYLHKTGLVAEQLLMRLLKRAKELSSTGADLPSSSSLSFFLQKAASAEAFNENDLDTFAKLDDYDIVSAMKIWKDHDDFTLRTLSTMILDRKLLKIEFNDQPFSEERISDLGLEVLKKYSISPSELEYFVFQGEISNQAYSTKQDAIQLLTKQGQLIDVAEASDQLNLMALSKTVVKYYLCYPKAVY